jgi:hypothetical protein
MEFGEAVRRKPKEATACSENRRETPGLGKQRLVRCLRQDCRLAGVGEVMQ